VTTTWKDSANTSHDIVTTVTLPPALASFRLGYVYRSPKDPPRACVTYSDFAWEDHTEEARWRGASFEPYARVADRTPALYLGFDRPLPADLVSLYVDVQEVIGDTRGPDLRWEYWDGTAWSAVAVQDATAGLALPGMVSVLWPGTDPPPTAAFRQASGTSVQAADHLDAAQFRPHDLVQVGQDDGSSPELATVAGVSGDTLSLTAPLAKAYPRGTVVLAAFPRFGTPRTWLRARLQVDGEPRASRVNGVFTNAVWASQIQTFQGEPLGSSNGQANQTMSFRYSPVLAGQVVEVRELDGQRAEVELPILREELAQQGFGPADIRTVEDPRTGRASEVWVRWRERPNLFFSGPSDRDYVLERSRGRLRFGDDVHGRIPPAGTDDVRAAEYRSGGGVVGNVPAGAISQLLSGVLAQSVANARAAEGGADGEPSSRVAGRGSKVVRHRMQALSFEDYEALAREASPAVAVARALPLTRPNGLPATGWVKVIIMPQSAEPMPEPSFELRREVLEYLQARIPASMAGQVGVAAPDYLPIGVETQVAPVDPSLGGPVAAAAIGALQAFFHPLTGGPEGEGWPFGRDVFLSDVARVLESVPGVDYVPTLELLLEGTPRGEVVEVPPDRIVVAGAIRVHPTEEEG
jgi:hypothetical protein